MLFSIGLRFIDASPESTWFPFYSPQQILQVSEIYLPNTKGELVLKSIEL